MHRNVAKQRAKEEVPVLVHSNIARALSALGQHDVRSEREVEDIADARGQRLQPIGEEVGHPHRSARGREARHKGSIVAEREGLSQLAHLHGRLRRPEAENLTCVLARVDHQRQRVEFRLADGARYRVALALGPVLGPAVARRAEEPHLHQRRRGVGLEADVHLQRARDRDRGFALTVELTLVEREPALSRHRHVQTRQHQGLAVAARAVVPGPRHRDARARVYVRLDGDLRVRQGGPGRRTDHLANPVHRTLHRTRDATREPPQAASDALLRSHRGGLIELVLIPRLDLEVALVGVLRADRCILRHVCQEVVPAHAAVLSARFLGHLAQNHRAEGVLTCERLEPDQVVDRARNQRERELCTAVLQVAFERERERLLFSVRPLGVEERRQVVVDAHLLELPKLVARLDVDEHVVHRWELDDLAIYFVAAWRGLAESLGLVPAKRIAQTPLLLERDGRPDQAVFFRGRGRAERGRERSFRMLALGPLGTLIRFVEDLRGLFVAVWLVGPVPFRICVTPHEHKHHRQDDRRADTARPSDTQAGA